MSRPFLVLDRRSPLAACMLLAGVPVSSRMGAFAEAAGAGLWRTGNDELDLQIVREASGCARLARLRALGRSLPSTSSSVAPQLEVDGRPSLAFTGCTVQGSQLVLEYRGADQLRVRHVIQPSQRLPVLRTWTILSNPGPRTVRGIRRFDALGVGIGVGGREPSATYLLGWLYGPRLDAPGHPSVSFPYPSWLPDLLYGDTAPSPPAPPPEWPASLLRLVRGERLTRLCLRSGKRSTFETFPWIAVMDPEAGSGFFAGLCWSGQWRMEATHEAAAHAVSLAAGSDGCTHDLDPGGTLESPSAFLGFFRGDWDDAANACRRYVRTELMPPLPQGFPFATSGIAPYSSAAFDDGRLAWREEIDAAAEAGIGAWDIDAAWWEPRFGAADFSEGLGGFAANLRLFPEGLRAVSDYAHRRGMRLGLWFEIERVDIRTAGKGRPPWRPEWLVHQAGHLRRSWCQHVYCLGASGAAAWALESVSRAVREYGLDRVLVDSNQWAVCDDPSHGHGAGDGEWAQIRGLHEVLRGLRERFPDLVIINLGGGCQRADFGMAGFSHVFCPSDVICPPTVNRVYGTGMGTIYPVGSIGSAVADCPAQTSGADPQRIPSSPREELEWRCLNAMAGHFSVLLQMRNQGVENRSVLREAVAFHRRIAPTLLGDRFILEGPADLRDTLERGRGYREADAWEAYQYAAPEGDRISVFAFRCASTEEHRTWRLRDLDPQAWYRASCFPARERPPCTGHSLMEMGLDFHLPRMMTACAVSLERMP